MKKLFTIFSVLFLMTALAACGGKEDPTTPTPTEPLGPVSIDVSQVDDGIYFAAENGFSNSGFKYYAIILVEDGKIIEAEWNAYNRDGYLHRCEGAEKITCAAEGNYRMHPNNPEKEWHVQAEATVDFVLNKETIELEYSDNSGKTDAIAGVTVTVNEFFGLIVKAFENGPVDEGDYVDGYYFVKGEETARNDRDGNYIEQEYSFVTTVIVNGTIVLYDLNTRYTVANPANEDRPFLTKDSAGQNYGMHRSSSMGADGEWFKQAERIEVYIIDNQTLDGIEIDAETSKTDDIAGVTMRVQGYFDLWLLVKTAISA